MTTKTGNGSSTNGGSNGTALNTTDLTGSCALRLLALSTPGALLPDQKSTVLAGVYTFDGKGGLAGDVASNGATANGFTAVTSSYELNRGLAADVGDHLQGAVAEQSCRLRNRG